MSDDQNPEAPDAGGEPTDAAAPESAPARTRPARFGPFKREAQSFIELFAIAGLAFAQPALDVLSKNTEVLLSRRADTLEVLVLTALVLLVPPVVAWLLEVLAGVVHPPIRRWVHAVLIAVFAGVLLEEVVKQASGLTAEKLIAIGVIGAAGAVWLVIKVEAIRTFLRFLAFAPLVFALLFLFASPVTSAVISSAPASATSVKITNPKRVVMIVMDEFPLQSLMDGHGNIDASLYPNFAQLSQQTTWYRNDTTVAKYTNFAVPSIETGRLPKDPDAVPTSVDYPDNIFRLLGNKYRMNVHEQNFQHLCPSNVCADRRPKASTPSTVKSLVDETTDLWKTFASPKRAGPVKLIDVNLHLPAVRTAREFTQSLKPGTERIFDFVHLMVPHQPWRFNQALQDDGSSDLSQGAGIGSWDSDSSATLAHERHILNTQAADTMVGRVIAKLKRIGAWDDSVVVVTADHGIAFKPDEPLRGATLDNYQEILWTPLFIKAPRQKAGGIDDRPMQSIDIVPTVADLIGAKIPWKVDGTSALGAPRAEFKRQYYAWGPQQPGELWADPPKFLTFDAPSGFKRMLDTAAVDPVGPPELRPYRIGKYKDLIGQSVTGRVQEKKGGPTLLYLDHPELYANIVPTAKMIPWSAIQGYVVDLSEVRPLAFAANGKIVGLSWARPLAGSKDGFYFGSMAPSLFTPGVNKLTAYTISGPADAPVFEPLPINGNPGGAGG